LRNSVSLEVLDEARRRLDEGDPRSAHRLAEEALEATRASGSTEHRWLAAHLAGEALFVMGDIAGARVHASEALRLSQAGGDPEALGSDLNLLGLIEAVEGRPEEAVFLLRRSYDLRAEGGGPDSSGAIESLSNLAFAMWATDDDDQALELHEEALRRSERAFGENHPRTAETLAALAVRLGAQPESRKRARKLHERALASAEAAHGPDSALVARLLANAAVARIDDGDLESAGRALERALELHERHFGPDSRWTGYVVHSRGDYAYELGRYDDARSAFERALVLRVRELGPERRETLDSARALANALKEGSFANAATEQAEELERVVRALHPDPADARPAEGGLDPAQAAEQLRRIAAGIENRATAEPSTSRSRPRVGSITAVDYHTGGEPFRIVTGGVEPPWGGTILERRRDALERLDHVRRLLVFEPRGHADMYGCFVVPPDDDGADLGVVFFHNAGYATACGHGTIALVTWALDEDVVERREGENHVVVDVPSGRLETWAHVQGDRVRSVRFRNVPSYVHAEGVELDDGTRVDLVFGGAFYASLPERIEPEELPRLIARGREIKRQIEAEHDVVHPLEPELRDVYGVVFWQDEGEDPLTQRNVAVFADGEVDRSPCGSGTSARLALLERQGRLPRGAEFVHRSIVGSEFRARVVGDAEVAGIPAVVTEVEGSAFRTGEHVFTLDPEDPLAEGFLLR